jgi:hypothetical protein
MMNKILDWPLKNVVDNWLYYNIEDIQSINNVHLNGKKFRSSYKWQETVTKKIDNLYVPIESSITRWSPNSVEKSVS